MARIADELGGSGTDMKGRIGKVSGTLMRSKNICNSKQLSANTGVRNLNIR